MKKALLTHCLRLSRQSLSKHPEYRNFPHWTFLVRDNQIITVGVNRRLEPLRAFGYHQHDDPTFIPKLHSELDAVRRCIRGMRGLEVVNIRLNRRGQVRVSKSCRACKRLLSALAVKRVFFTTSDGWGEL